MTTETDLVREKKPFLTNKSVLNEGKVKFQWMKQDMIRQEYFQKHEKRQ